MLEDIDKIQFHTNQTPEQLRELEACRKEIDDQVDGNPKLALQKIQEYKLLSLDYGHKEHLIWQIYYVGLALYHTGDNEKSLECCNIALKHAIKKELLYKIQICLGAVYTYFGHFSDAINSYNIALSSNKESVSPTIYNNIAAIYFKQKDFKKAIEYFNKGLELAGNNKNQTLLILNNIGRSYIELNDLETAGEILLAAEQMLENHDNPAQEVINTLNIGLLYLRKEHYKKAYDKLFEAYIKCKELDIKNNAYSATFFLAQACAKNNMPDQANQYFIETMALVVNLDKRLYINTVKDYITFLIEQQDFERASSYFMEYDIIKDDIIKIDKEKHINALTVKFQNTEQKLEIEKLNKEKEFQNMLLAQAEDIKRSNEKLVEINQNLSDFSYALSHDIRTPIRQLAGFGSMIRNKNYEGKEDLLKQDLNYIYEAAKKADTMIQELHKFSIVGVQEEHFKNIDANEALKDALGSLAQLIAESDAQINIKNALPFLKGDKTLITQLFQNIIANAIKYKQQHIAPKIEMFYEEKDGIKRISIQDNGIGIPLNEQKDIFKLFGRASNHGNVEGTGIGLSFCQKIIHKMNGNIHLVSAGSNQGTTFYLDFP